MRQIVHGPSVTAYWLCLILGLPQVLSSWQSLHLGIACLLALGLTDQS